ncbi:Rv1733c family protein [Streptomyces sp. NPDC001107]
MTKTHRAGAKRVWFWRWRRNPLRRRSNRLEAWILLAACTLALLGGLLAALATYGAVQDDLAARRADVHSVSAVLTQDAPRIPAVSTSGYSDDKVWAKVRWVAADGSTHTGTTRVEPGTAVGTRITAWTDHTGRLVLEPASATEAWLQTALFSAAAAMGAGAVVLAGERLARGRLDRWRLAEWDAQWARVGPQWRKRMLG